MKFFKQNKFNLKKLYFLINWLFVWPCHTNQPTN